MRIVNMLRSSSSEHPHGKPSPINNCGATHKFVLAPKTLKLHLQFCDSINDNTIIDNPFPRHHLKSSWYASDDTSYHRNACSSLTDFLGASQSSARVKPGSLWNKSREDLKKQLDELKLELGQMRIQKIAGGSQSKLNRMYATPNNLSPISPSNPLTAVPIGQTVLTPTTLQTRSP